jgi:AcrR family transcriptional regulator
MPKRDEAYMAGQRDRITRGALAVLMEKGVYETSLRDICARAGVSIGAFYNLFPTKAEAIVAARYLDLTETRFIPKANDWRGYVASLVTAFCSRDEQALRRRRISLQFAAEILLMERNPGGQPAIIDVQARQMAENLQAVFDKGEVSLPFGLDRTVEIHAQIALGASYRLSNDLDLTVEEAASLLEDGLAATAGRIAPGRS